MVTSVLGLKVVEQAMKLVEGRVESSCLLSLVLGKRHLQYQPVRNLEKDRASDSDSVSKSNSEMQRWEALLARFEAILPRFNPSSEVVNKGRKTRVPSKRETILFAAILLELKGTKYCSFLDKNGPRPKWADAGPANYLKSYQAGDPWRKKVQDEKTRAKHRMKRYAHSDLMTAIVKYLPTEFDKVSAQLAQLAPSE